MHDVVSFLLHDTYMFAPSLTSKAFYTPLLPMLVSHHITVTINVGYPDCIWLHAE